MNQKPLGIKIISAVWSLYALMGLGAFGFVIFSYVNSPARLTTSVFGYLGLFALLSFVFAWFSYATWSLMPKVLFWNVFLLAGNVIKIIFDVILGEAKWNWQISNILIICYCIWAVIYFLRPQTKALFREKKT